MNRRLCACMRVLCERNVRAARTRPELVAGWAVAWTPASRGSGPLKRKKDVARGPPNLQF